MWKGDPKVNFFQQTWNSYSDIEILGRHLERIMMIICSSTCPFFGGFSFLSGLVVFATHFGQLE